MPISESESKRVEALMKEMTDKGFTVLAIPVTSGSTHGDSCPLIRIDVTEADGTPRHFESLAALERTYNL